MSNATRKTRPGSRERADLRRLMKPSIEVERKENRQFVTALARGLEVLSVFRPFEGPLSNQELAKRSGLPKPTVSRITYTLMKLGYLEYIPGVERYRLGTAVLALGYAFRGGLEIRKLAKPHMDEFVANTGATVALCAPYRLSFIIYEIVSSKESMRLMLDVGSRIEVASTPATGAYFEAIPSADRKIIEELAGEAEAEVWAALQDDLTRCRKEAAERGFCVFPSPIARNVNVAAAAMVTPSEDKVFLFQAYSHNFEIDREEFYEKIGPALLHMTEMIKIEAVNWNL